MEFMEFFPLLSCLLKENYIRSWAFPAFVGSKLKQHPAVMYDMVNREEVIHKKRPERSVYSQTQYSRQSSVIMLLHRALSHVFPISYVIICK